MALDAAPTGVATPGALDDAVISPALDGSRAVRAADVAGLRGQAVDTRDGRTALDRDPAGDPGGAGDLRQRALGRRGRGGAVDDAGASRARAEPGDLAEVVADHCRTSAGA